jgi:hypothetical protein
MTLLTPSLAFAAALAVFGGVSAAPTSARATSRDILAPCRGKGLASYVGRAYADLQRIRPDARYVCSTCPMTMDFRRDRLTVTYDEKTKRVTQLRCV